MGFVGKISLWSLLFFFCVTLIPSQVRADDEPPAVAPVKRSWVSKRCVLIVAAVATLTAAGFHLLYKSHNEEEGGGMQEIREKEPFPNADQKQRIRFERILP